MTLVALAGVGPRLDEGAWAAPTATIAGDVRICAGASIWYGVVIRADRDAITVGPGCNIQDLSVLHTDPGFHLEMGEGSSVGHRVILHGCVIRPNVLVGMGSMIMNGAVIGAGSVVGAGTLIPEGVQIPPNSLVIGSPGKVRRQTTDEERARIRLTAATYAELREIHRSAGPLTH